jgi:hypothetical protein
MKRRYVIERPITHGHQEGVQDRAILVGRAVRLRGVLHVRVQMLGKADRLPSPQPLLALQSGDPMFVGDPTGERAVGGARTLAIALPMKAIEKPERMPVW